MATLPGAQVDLGDDWSFAYSLETPPKPLTCMAELQAAGLHLMPCQVPGSFYDDLYRADLIDDPRDVVTLPALQAYEHAHVWYACRFAAQPPSETTPWLIFEGLDCCASIYLNGVLVGATDNALIPQRLPLSGALRPENELLVHISPARQVAQRVAYPPGVWAPPGHWEQLYLRRAPHTYGSAITPRAVSPGIWRAVHLTYEPREHLGQTYLRTLSITPSGSAARLALHYDLVLDEDSQALYELGIEMRCGVHVFADTRAIDFRAGCWELTLRDPQIWWPRGRGDAKIYRCRLTLLRDGLVIDQRSFDQGIRTVTVTPDRGLLVNGEPIFVQGVTWGPIDLLHHQDQERLPDLVDHAAALGCNLIRCWAGNGYDDDLFYELCDQQGLLVWQEFALLDAVYPQNDAFGAVLREEARAVVRRLRQHPSLALWVGDCDGDQAWRSQDSGRLPEQNPLTRQVLPALLAEEDPGRPYLPSAPADDPLLSLAASPSRHNVNTSLSTVSCSSPEFLQKLLASAQTWPEGAAGSEVLEQMLQHLRTWFSGVGDDPAEVCLASQFAQAEALKALIEGRRSAHGQSQGLVWWHLADALVQISSAVIDAGGQPKLAYDTIQQAQQPLLLMLHHRAEGGHSLLASSHLRQAEQVQYWVSDVDTFEMLCEGEGRVMPDAVTALAKVPATPGVRRCLLIEWRDSQGAIFHNHHLDGAPPYDLQGYQHWLQKAEI